jgi:hypothetical protein
MLFKDWQADGTTYAKDPCVVYFKGCAWLYYSAHGLKEIGIAVSDDYENWTIKGYIKPETEAEGHMICAPAAIVINDVLHLFYQSYGNFPRDYICHAWSEDGIVFHRDPTNPIIRPSGEWNAGRAIDADVIAFGDKLYCYWASRDPSCEIQLLGVSTAPLDSGFHAQDWTQQCTGPILQPELPWEQACIEAPAALVHQGKVYMFYAGAYNCCPQQINCAVSDDGIHFTRICDQPLQGPGQEGSWNASESGHPYVWQAEEGKIHLFYQGSPDHGKNWMISRVEVLKLSPEQVVLSDTLQEEWRNIT